MSRPVLGRRALNRALLARQHLLGDPAARSSLGVVDMVEHLLGLQAQAPDPPYFGLWSRLDGFRPDDLSNLLLDRTVVRTSLMRGTIHLVSAADQDGLRAFVQPFYDRDAATGQNAGRLLPGLDLRPVADAGRALVHEAPRSQQELRDHLAGRWPDRDPSALAHAVHDLVPLVQVTPRGVWGQAGQPRWTTADAWLGRPSPRTSTAEGRTAIIRRYLAAFGPASTQDVQAWSGVTRLGEVIDTMRPELVTFADEHGRELFDLPDAPRPDPETPAPVRFVAPFDNLTLAHADRTRIVAEDDRKRMMTTNGIVPGTILVDGFVAGTWTLAKGRDGGSFGAERFRRLTAAQSTAVRERSAELLAFVAGAGARTPP